MVSYVQCDLLKNVNLIVMDYWSILYLAITDTVCPQGIRYALKWEESFVYNLHMCDVASDPTVCSAQK